MKRIPCSVIIAPQKSIFQALNFIYSVFNKNPKITHFFEIIVMR